MSNWPDADECRRILQEAGCDAGVIAHTAKVAQVADAITVRVSRRTHVDRLLVQAGALLHDVGRGWTHGLDHALEGAEHLRRLGLPEPLCLIVERHTGGGIDAAEARLLGLVAKDYTPRTLEERIVCHADNLVDGARRQKVQEELSHLRGRGLERVATKIQRLHQELSDLAGIDLDAIP